MNFIALILISPDLTKNFIILGLILCDGHNDKPVSNQVFSANASAKKQGTKNEYC